MAGHKLISTFFPPISAFVEIKLDHVVSFNLADLCLSVLMNLPSQTKYQFVYQANYGIFVWLYL